jgi:hypothetical protein
MSTQRFISTSFWDDRWIQNLDPSEKLVYIYLLSNPLTNIAGVYKIENRRISFDTGFTEDIIKLTLDKFEAAGKVYRIDEYIAIPTWPKHQRWDKSPKIKNGIIAILRALEKKYLDKLVAIGYKFDLKIVYDTLSIPYTYGSSYSDLDSDLDSDQNSNSEKETEAAPPVVENPLPVPKPQKPEGKPKKPPLREREPANDMERVEKAYFQNWDALYSQGWVKTAEPVVNWNQTRKLLKTHFEKLKAEQIIQAIHSGMKDDWIMNGGYSLGVMLSASVLNRLINAGSAAPGGGAGGKKSLSGLVSIF